MLHVEFHLQYQNIKKIIFSETTEQNSQILNKTDPCLGVDQVCFSFGATCIII